MSEFAEQCALFAWKHYMVNQYPPLRYLYATGNGLRLSKGVIGKAKASGCLERGCPDVWLPYPVGEYAGFVFELKAGKNTLTPEQHEWLDTMREWGWKVGVFYSHEEAEAALVAYLEGVGQPANPYRNEED